MAHFGVQWEVHSCIYLGAKYDPLRDEGATFKQVLRGDVLKFYLLIRKHVIFLCFSQFQSNYRKNLAGVELESFLVVNEK